MTLETTLIVFATIGVLITPLLAVVLFMLNRRRGG
jgi:hypothetical protein